jgi:N-acylneuraminate cytidylyltransferase
MKIVAVILARGGSKGIPKKNIIPLNGKPLISYTIEAANHSIVNETWVSTDCEEIKKVSWEFGASVLNRPDSISGDKSKSEEALLDFANKVDFDFMVFIQPTSPMLTSDDINAGLRQMVDNNCDSLFSAYKEHWIPRWSIDGGPHQWDINNRPMRQDVSEKYVENGAFYITTKKSLLKSGLRYSGNIGVYEMPMLRSFQIDTVEDLELIEKMMK